MTAVHALLLTLVASSSPSSAWAAPAHEPLPDLAVDAAKAKAGRRLFFDNILSRERNWACSSCHQAEHGGADGQRISPGPKGNPRVNTPSIFNSAHSFRQTWGGGVLTIEDVIERPMTRPFLMGWEGSDAVWEEVPQRLRADTTYVAMFAPLGGITPATIKGALADYLRSIVPRRSRFDRYLKDDPSAELTKQEVDGYTKFRELGCASCHQGKNVGGNMLAKFGVMRDYFDCPRDTPPIDAHCFDFERDGGLAKDLKSDSKKRADAGLPTLQWEEWTGFFRVPSLRNVALTAPYFHNGSAATLEDAVETMAKYQLGRSISAADRDDIVAFLKTLTGVIPEEARAPSIGGAP